MPQSENGFFSRIRCDKPVPDFAGLQAISMRRHKYGRSVDLFRLCHRDYLDVPTVRFVALNQLLKRFSEISASLVHTHQLFQFGADGGLEDFEVGVLLCFSSLSALHRDSRSTLESSITLAV